MGSWGTSNLANDTAWDVFDRFIATYQQKTLDVFFEQMPKELFMDGVTKYQKRYNLSFGDALANVGEYQYKFYKFMLKAGLIPENNAISNKVAEERMYTRFHNVLYSDSFEPTTEQDLFLDGVKEELVEDCIERFNELSLDHYDAMHAVWQMVAVFKFVSNFAIKDERLEVLFMENLYVFDIDFSDCYFEDVVSEIKKVMAHDKKMIADYYN